MISRENAEHYIWGDNCDGWRLINEEDRSVIHERMPPTTRELRHFHNYSKQFFFILSGTMTIEVNGIEYSLKEHEGIEVHPKVSHLVMNKSDNDIEFLVISQPNTRNDRILID